MAIIHIQLSHLIDPLKELVHDFILRRYEKLISEEKIDLSSISYFEAVRADSFPELIDPDHGESLRAVGELGRMYNETDITEDRGFFSQEEIDESIIGCDENDLLPIEVLAKPNNDPNFHTYICLNIEGRFDAGIIHLKIVHIFFS